MWYIGCFIVGFVLGLEFAFQVLKYGVHTGEITFKDKKKKK